MRERTSMISSERAAPCGSVVILAEDVRGVYRVTRVISDIESYKYGDAVYSRWFTNPERALIAYGVARLREHQAWS